jgi:hypothetical protein
VQTLLNKKEKTEYFEQVCSASYGNHPLSLKAFHVFTAETLLTYLTKHAGFVPPANGVDSDIRSIGMNVMNGQEGCPEVGQCKDAKQDPEVERRQAAVAATDSLKRGVEVCVRVSALVAERARSLRLTNGDVNLSQPTAKYIPNLDAVTQAANFVSVIDTAEMILQNEGGSLATTSPSIMLSATNVPHATSLEFLLAWICILALQCTSACHTDELMEAMFSEHLFEGPGGLEHKFVDYWYLSCFVAKVHWFIFSHLLGPEEAAFCKLEFDLPEKFSAVDASLSDTLFEYAVHIAERKRRFNFVRKNMEDARGVLDGITGDQLKSMGSTYCRLMGVANSGDWDAVRAHFRTFMVVAARPRKAPKVDAPAAAQREAILLILQRVDDSL